MEVAAVKYVAFYDLVPGAEALAQQHVAAHRRRLMAFHARGDLLQVGSFTDFPTGAMAVFASRAAVDEFIDGDPFVRYGVVLPPRVREWNEILSP